MPRLPCAVMSPGRVWMPSIDAPRADVAALAATGT